MWFVVIIIIIITIVLRVTSLLVFRSVATTSADDKLVGYTDRLSIGHHRTRHASHAWYGAWVKGHSITT